MKAKLVKESLSDQNIYDDPYVSDDTRHNKKPKNDQTWSFQPDDEFVFNARGMESEFEYADEADILKYDGKMGIIDSPETASEIGSPEYEYYNVWFPGDTPGSGERFIGVSAYHFDRIDNNE